MSVPVPGPAPAPGPGELSAGTVVDAATLPLAHEPLPAADVQSGSPTTGAEALAALGGLELGVWEMSVGVACDTEVDELFVVLTGRAVV